MPNRGKSGKFRRDPVTAEQDARACDMFARGYTYREISAELGWSNPASAYKAVERAYKATVGVPAEHARRRQLERLDHAHRKVRRILDTEHVMVSQGRIVRDDDGTPVLDPTPNLNAAARIESIEARIAKLLGLDAPTKHSVDVVTRDAFAEEMERMAAELEDRAPYSDDEAAASAEA
jgi:hypothetical protein